MSYSYSTVPLSYGPNEQFGYDVVAENQQVPNERKKHPSLVAGGVGALVGLGAGAIIGSKRNPYMKNGIPTDNFAKLSYDKFVKTAPEDVKKSYGQYNEVINKIDKVRTTDELKTLLNNNQEASKEVSTSINKTTEEFLSSVSDTNLASNKEMIKKKLKAANDIRYQNMKNEISNCWNAEQKKFIKPAGMDDNMFNAIQKTTRRVKAGFIAKWAAISAAVLGVVTFVAHKIIKHKKESAQQT